MNIIIEPVISRFQDQEMFEFHPEFGPAHHCSVCQSVLAMHLQQQSHQENRHLGVNSAVQHFHTDILLMSLSVTTWKATKFELQHFTVALMAKERSEQKMNRFLVTIDNYKRFNSKCWEYWLTNLVWWLQYTVFRSPATLSYRDSYVYICKYFDVFYLQCNFASRQ